MNWKVVVKAKQSSGETVRILAERTGLNQESILKAFNREEEVVCKGLSEGEAQEIADSLRRYPGVRCLILLDNEEEIESIPLFRVLLVNYRPGYRTRLRRRLQRLTRLPQEQVVNWLSRMPFALSKGIDSETANRIKKSITEAGGIVRIEAESIPENSISTRRRSNAVFRIPGTVYGTCSDTAKKEDTDTSASLAGVNTGTCDEGVEGIPPVRELPEPFTAGPPPLDEIETSHGRVYLNSPARYAVGVPTKSEAGGLHVNPPVLPDVSNLSAPDRFEFSPPDIIREELPSVVGVIERSLLPDGPPPDIVIFFPPPSRISEEFFLPPVFGDSTEGHFTAGFNLTDDGEVEYDLESASSEDKVLRLFLCTPSPVDEDRITDALHDVMGISLRESRELLRKTPVLLGTFVDHRRAIRTAHELESRGVTVSLTRGNLSTGIPAARSSGGFQAWLSKNG